MSEAAFNLGLATADGCRQRYTSDLLMNANLAARPDRLVRRGSPG